MAEVRLIENDIIIRRNAVQQQIPRYENVEHQYTPFEDIPNSDAISFEKLKNKKFNTLLFDGKWQELIGTPEANFCLVVYGKPGQGKSYFTLELSEYLATNFGSVLFNSSEEGSSQSLQRKIESFNTQNIYLGVAKDINSLQLLLTKSPYKFVVIDSINDMRISPNELNSLRKIHNDKAFICILQSTKSGGFKGGSEFEHDTDISIKIEDRIAECIKTRYK